MTTTKQQRYTSEFRAEAVNLVFEQGLSLETGANRLSISKGTQGNWIAAVKASKHQSVSRARSATDLEAENSRLRKALLDVNGIQTGEFATLAFQIEAGLLTKISVFSIFPNASVIVAARNATIPGISVVVQSLTLR